MKKVPTNVINLKSKVDKVDVDKLVPVPVALSKLSDELKNDVVKKDAYNAKIKNIEDKIPDITSVASNAAVNAKINEIKNNISKITKLATTNTALTAVENKIPNVSSLSRKLTMIQKSVKFKIKLLLIMIIINMLLLKNLIS